VSSAQCAYAHSPERRYMGSLTQHTHSSQAETPGCYRDEKERERDVCVCVYVCVCVCVCVCVYCQFCSGVFSVLLTPPKVSLRHSSHSSSTFQILTCSAMFFFITTNKQLLSSVPRCVCL